MKMTKTAHTPEQVIRALADASHSLKDSFHAAGVLRWDGSTHCEDFEDLVDALVDNVAYADGQPRQPLLVVNDRRVSVFLDEDNFTRHDADPDIQAIEYTTSGGIRWRYQGGVITLFVSSERASTLTASAFLAGFRFADDGFVGYDTLEAKRRIAAHAAANAFDIVDRAAVYAALLALAPAPVAESDTEYTEGAENTDLPPGQRALERLKSHTLFDTE